MPDKDGKLSEEEIKEIELRLKQLSCKHPKPEIAKKVLILPIFGMNEGYHVLT